MGDNKPPGNKENAIPEIKSLFGHAAQKVSRERRFEIPAKLHHYTSAEGLKGIVENNCLWFSDTRFLNDSSESQLGVLLVEEALKRQQKKNKYFTDEIIQVLVRATEKANDQLSPIIFCASEESNLLNQWRDYGKDVTPYCISFNTEELLLDDVFNFPIFIVEMIYNREEMLNLFSKLLNEIEDVLFENLNMFDVMSLQNWNVFLRAGIELAWLALHTKNESFQAEKEWRLVAPRNDVTEQCRYRSSNLGIIPYFEWRKKDRSKLGINSVMVGPTPYSEASQVALSEFMQDFGYEVDIYRSEIPIRR